MTRNDCGRCTEEPKAPITRQQTACSCMEHCGNVSFCLCTREPWGADLDVSKRARYGFPQFA